MYKTAVRSVFWKLSHLFELRVIVRSRVSAYVLVGVCPRMEPVGRWIHWEIVDSTRVNRTILCNHVHGNVIRSPVDGGGGSDSKQQYYKMYVFTAHYVLQFYEIYFCYESTSFVSSIDWGVDTQLWKLRATFGWFYLYTFITNSRNQVRGKYVPVLVTWYSVSQVIVQLRIAVVTRTLTQAASYENNITGSSSHHI